eukprot:scaffold447904_cov22-Prasinocladus_malaysianus.AAC.1
MNKRWGKLLAKQRKEEFKKIAFRPEEVDTALICAGIAIPADKNNASSGGGGATADAAADASSRSLNKSGTSIGARSNAS